MLMQCRVCARTKTTHRVTILNMGGGNGTELTSQQQQDTFYPLRCGDAYCRACLVDLARASLLAHQLIPLRCCQQRVPLEWIDRVLEEPEAVYYRFLVDKATSTTTTSQSQRQLTIQRESQALEVDDSEPSDGVHPMRTPTETVPCAGCNLSWSHLFELQCGHSLCAECLARLCRAHLDIGESPSCCSIPISTSAMVEAQKLQAAASALTPSSMIIIDYDKQQAGAGDQRQAPPAAPAASAQKPQWRQSKRPSFGKGKKRTTTAKKAEVRDEVDLVSSTASILAQHCQNDDDLDEDELVIIMEQPRVLCFSCKKLVLTTEASCGHAFCHKCIGDRCHQAVNNDMDGGIGLPVRCCDELLALEMVRPAITKHMFTQYEKVVAKSEDALKKLSKRKRSANGKQKAKAKAPVEAPTPPAAKRLRLTGSGYSIVSATASDEASASTSETTTASSECVACMDEISVDTPQFKGPCGHVYCAECLTFMAKKSLKDRALVPIRCCSKELPAEYVSRVLPTRSVGTYNRFLREKDWRSSNLKSDKEYAQLIKRIGGKQCPKCGIGVQKITGCNAMSCAHGHRFCWGCGDENCKCFSTNGPRY